MDRNVSDIQVKLASEGVGSAYRSPLMLIIAVDCSYFTVLSTIVRLVP